MTAAVMDVDVDHADIFDARYWRSVDYKLGYGVMVRRQMVESLPDFILAGVGADADHPSTMGVWCWAEGCNMMGIDHSNPEAIGLCPVHRAQILGPGR